MDEFESKIIHLGRNGWLEMRLSYARAPSSGKGSFFSTTVLKLQ